ncbi:MAG: APC family permease [Candidatus Woesearchaeota archaeon]|nr:APC family permease [Candidatus Woesearchaeota archaeon]
MFKRYKREAITLRRDLGLKDAVIAGVGIIVGAGIYVLIGAAAGHAQNGVWISFIIAAFIAFLTGLSYAELSSIYSSASGEYSYIEHAFGKKIAFIAAYLVLLSGVISAAAVSLGFSGYLNSLLNTSSIIPIAIAAIIISTLINIVGIKSSMNLTIFMTVSSIIGLLAIIVLALPHFGKVDYFDFPGITSLFKASSLIFFAYIGFESVVKLSEETKNPRKNIPLALMISLGISSIIYILTAIAAISVIPWNVLSSSSAPLADVGRVLLGSNAHLAISLIAVMATGNTIIMVLVTISRMIYSMAKEYPKIAVLSSVNKFTNTPHIAIIFTGLLSLLFLFLGSIETVAEITNFAVFTVFGLINLALIKIRFMKHRHEMFHEPLNIGKFPLLGFLGFLTCIFMIANLETKAVVIGSLLMASGLLIYTFIKPQ